MPISTERRSSDSREGIAVTQTSRWARGGRRAGPWIAAGLVLLILAASGGARYVPALAIAPAVGHAHPPAVSKTVDLNLTDAPRFVPDSISAAPGTQLSVHLTNTGVYPHSFTLSSVSNATLAPSLTPTELNATFAAHHPLANVSVPAKSSGWANFTLGADTGLDSFEFVSQVPYQFQAGMRGFLNVTSSAVPYTMSTNTTNTFSYQPAILAVEPTAFPAVVAVTVTNLGGEFVHTFTVVAQVNTNISTVGYFHTNAPLANITINAKTGATGVVNFTIPSKGVYEFVCTEPGHFTSGMLGHIYAGVPAPAPPAAPSTAIVDTWILAGSIALLGIGLLLVVVAGFTGRLPRAPPPSDEHPY